MQAILNAMNFDLKNHKLNKKLICLLSDSSFKFVKITLQINSSSKFSVESKIVIAH